MIKTKIGLFVFLLVILLLIPSCDKGKTSNYDDKSKTSPSPTQLSTPQPDAEIVIEGDVNLLPEGMLDKLKSIYVQQFPLIWDRFGKGEMPEVTYKIDASYEEEGGIAYTTGKTVVLNPYWLVRNPEDVDCMTHELIHVAQSYETYNVSWLIEGIADYGRNVFGVNNTKAGWSLPSKYKGGKITDGYRVTAAFLVWVEEKYSKDFVDKLNVALKENKYKSTLWKELTGFNMNELWTEYKNE